MLSRSRPAKSRNFRESPEILHDLQVSRKCYKISRNLGNLIDLLFSGKRHAFRVNPRDADHRDPTSAYLFVRKIIIIIIILFYKA